ncbi:MAG: hypothetical protein ACR2PS_08710 [Pseudomonadales bacterium]
MAVARLVLRQCTVTLAVVAVLVLFALPIFLDASQVESMTLGTIPASPVVGRVIVIITMIYGMMILVVCPRRLPGYENKAAIHLRKELSASTARYRSK